MVNDVTARFLHPAHALDDANRVSADEGGLAETPGEDARCRIVINLDDEGRMRASFSAFGPPEVVACADWVCEHMTGQHRDNARRPGIREIEQALALAPIQRYAGILAIDALANAMINLGR